VQRIPQINYKRMTVNKFFKKIQAICRANISFLKSPKINFGFIADSEIALQKGRNVIVSSPYHLMEVSIGDYTYVSQNAYISNTNIGKFCSIGPNVMCGWGTHPTKGLSTNPMFYSDKKQNGMTLCTTSKFDEYMPISIGNDVFIGANVTILDGVTIGDGAIIGAGAVVSKNIPPYAIAIGTPINIHSYRFDEPTIDALLKIKWWNFDEQQLTEVERLFFDINGFIERFQKK